MAEGHQSFQILAQITRAQQEFMMLGVKGLSRFARCRQLTVTSLVEAYRESAQGPGAELRRHRDDRARVHAAAQKHADGDIRDQAQLHRLAQQLDHLFADRLRPPVLGPVGLFAGNVPPGSDPAPPERSTSM